MISKPLSVEDRVRCDACGAWNTFDRPHGGEYNTITDSSDDETNFLANADGPQGCWFCGSPALYERGRITWGMRGG